MTDTSLALTIKELQEAIDSLEEAQRNTQVLFPAGNAGGKSSSTPDWNLIGQTYLHSAAAATAHSKNVEFFEAPKYRDTKGTLVYGVRMENTQPGHNKEYTVTVTAVPLAGASSKSGANEYTVEGAWGVIAQAQTKQVKDIDGKKSTSNKTRAIEAAKDLERAKKAKGYVEQFKFDEEEDLDDDMAADLDWVITDDLIVSPDDSTTASIVHEVDRECFCYQTAEELSQFSYADPTPAGLDIAPLIMGQGYGFTKFDDVKRGARWIVSVLSNCNPYPEPHARAVPVGEEMSDPALKDRRRSTPQYVEDLIIDAIDPVVRLSGTMDFALLVEEKGVDLIVVDALRWEGEDLTDESWMQRRNIMDGTFRSIFNTDRKSGRHITLAPRIINRLRESYLSEGNKSRFELYSLDGRPGAETWLMPRI